MNWYALYSELRKVLFTSVLFPNVCCIPFCLNSEEQWEELPVFLSLPDFLKSGNCNVMNLLAWKHCIP